MVPGLRGVGFGQMIGTASVIIKLTALVLIKSYQFNSFSASGGLLLLCPNCSVPSLSWILMPGTEKIDFSPS